MRWRETGKKLRTFKKDENKLIIRNTGVSRKQKFFPKEKLHNFSKVLKCVEKKLCLEAKFQMKTIGLKNYN